MMDRLPGHILVLQFKFSVAAPKFCWTQVFPPLTGVGFVQERVLDFVPVPHDLEQLPHSDH